MAQWSIRARLTLWYSAILLAGLALFGGGIWLVVSHSLMASLDDGLTAQAKGVSTVIHTEFDPSKPEQLHEELSEYADATPEGNLMEVLDSRGNPIVSSKVLHLSPTAVASQDGFGMQTAASHRYRTFITTALVRGEPFRILVGHPLDNPETPLRRPRALLLWLTP